MLLHPFQGEGQAVMQECENAFDRGRVQKWPLGGFLQRVGFLSQTCQPDIARGARQRMRFTSDRLDFAFFPRALNTRAAQWTFFEEYPQYLDGSIDADFFRKLFQKAPVQQIQARRCFFLPRRGLFRGRVQAFQIYRPGENNGHAFAVAVTGYTSRPK